jgi:hypothetical protein
MIKRRGRVKQMSLAGWYGEIKCPPDLLREKVVGLVHCQEESNRNGESAYADLQGLTINTSITTTPRSLRMTSVLNGQRSASAAQHFTEVP